MDLPPEKVHQLVAAFERLIAAELSHPVLAAPVATGMSDVAAFLVQDYIAADSLDLVVREFGPAPPADALRVAAQLAGALDFAAAVNVFHGALHPRDVLLSSDETRLTGIGVARALAQVGVTAPVRRPYAAPERAANASWDRRADVFSLAALVHDLLWGKRVSGTGRDAADALTAIPGGDLEALRAVFARALAEDPEARYQSALDFADALKDAFPDVVVNDAAVASPSTKAAPIVSEQRLPLDAPAIDPDLAGPASSSQTLALDTVLHKPVPRYDDVEETREPVERAMSIDEPTVAAPAGLITGGADAEASSVLERTRSAVWPLVLALTVGLAIGFAAGYGVASRDRSSGSAGATATAGKEFTESPVAEAPRPGSEVGSKPDAREVRTPPHEVPRKPETTRADVRPSPETTPPPSSAPATPPPSVAPPAVTGRLLIRSTPAGASVSVDGRDVGKTPATLRDLERGPHRVRVTRDGYTAEERRVVISASRPAQSVNVSLTPVRTPQPTRTAQAPPASKPATAAVQFAGALMVDSRPTGAKVYLDGRLIGNTPLSVPTVPAGEHAVRLEREGYRRWSSSVRIVASENNRVTASLER